MGNENCNPINTNEVSIGVSIAERVFSKSQDYRLVPPGGPVVFFSHMSRTGFKAGDTRSWNPLRDMFSVSMTDNLASEIMRTELDAMFPESSIDWRDVDFADYGSAAALSACEEAALVLLSPITMDAPVAVGIAQDWGERKPVIVGGPYVSRNASSWHDKTDRKTLVFTKRVEGMLPKIFQLIQDGDHQGRTVSFPNKFNAYTDYHQLARRKTRSNLGNNLLGAPIEIGVGCNEGCEFCGLGYFAISERNPDEVITEMESLKEQGVNYLFITDDNLSIRRQDTLKTIFQFLYDNQMWWMGEGNSQILQDPELAELMGKTNFLCLHGIDDLASNEPVGRHMKNRTSKEIMADLEAFQRYGFAVFGSLILGLDGHKYPDTFIEIADYFFKSDVAVPVSLHLAVPFPHTPFHARLKKEGRILTNDLSKYNFGEVVYEPKNMSPEELVQGARWLQRELSDPKRIAKAVTQTVLHGKHKYLRFSRDFISFLALALDPLLVGLKTHPSFDLQAESRSLINLIWNRLPIKTKDAINDSR